MDSKGRILLVDDKKYIVESLQCQLQKRSYTVHTATSGEQALDIMHNNEIDILVTDIRMPGMNGVELIRQTRENYPEIRSIIITEYAELDSAAEAMRLGAINYLQKPDGVKINTVDSALEKGMRDKKIGEEQIQKKIDRRVEAEAGLRKVKCREACVALMRVCIRYWKNVILKDEVELAEKCVAGERKVWKLYKDISGFRPRRLIKYCNIDRIPENPKVEDVLDTAYFVLSYTPVKPDNKIKKELKQKIKELETLVQTSFL
ncbi:MAG: response regulator [Desulfobacterales bacterium]|nr:response regulator [Desulfobacterales bacterium]